VRRAHPLPWRHGIGMPLVSICPCSSQQQADTWGARACPREPFHKNTATQTRDTHTLNTRTVATQFTHTHTHLIHAHLIHTVATQTHSHAHLQRKHLVHTHIERSHLHASTQVSRLNCAFIFVKDRKRDRADFGSASFLVPRVVFAVCIRFAVCARAPHHLAHLCVRPCAQTPRTPHALSQLLLLLAWLQGAKTDATCTD